MFKKLCLAAAFVLSSGLIVQAADEKVVPEPAPIQQNFLTVEVPIYSQKLRFKLPTDWKHANTSQNEKTYLIEFVPKGEGLSDWKNLFSLQGVKDFDPAIKPEDVANSVASSFAEICPKTVVFTKIGARFLNDQEAFLAIIGCADMPEDNPTGLKKGMAEISYYVFIKGKRDLYIAHKSIRGAGFTPDKFPPFVEQAIGEMKNFFPIEFCALESGKGQCEK
ncbi:MAG: hypothetical protein OCD03_16960 [Hyphomicrobiales bacterium]